MATTHVANALKMLLKGKLQKEWIGEPPDCDFIIVKAFNEDWINIFIKELQRRGITVRYNDPF